MLSARPFFVTDNNSISIVPRLSSITKKPVQEDIQIIYDELYSAACDLKAMQMRSSVLTQLIGTEFKALRSEIVKKAEKILLKGNDEVGRVVYEIMWRKGYYEVIMVTKNYWQCMSRAGEPDQVHSLLSKIAWHLESGLVHYKQLIITLNEVFDLNLNNLMEDLSLSDILYFDEKFFEFYHAADINLSNVLIDCNADNRCYGYNMIHSALMSLGDLHRYYSDFNLETENYVHKRKSVLHYMEAFLLNPYIGRAQNQLGLLCFGKNKDLDAIYHFIHSLTCRVPFDFSETNILKIIASRAGVTEANQGCDDSKVKNFYTRFFEVVNIYFFGKSCDNFSLLCEGVLMDFRTLLRMDKSCFTETDIFKITAILLFCLSKLKMIRSPAITSLTMFIMKICEELVCACLSSLDDTLEKKYTEIETFKIMYAKSYEEKNVDLNDKNVTLPNENPRNSQHCSPFATRKFAYNFDRENCSLSCSSSTEEEALLSEDRERLNNRILDLNDSLTNTNNVIEEQEIFKSAPRRKRVSRRRKKYKPSRLNSQHSDGRVDFSTSSESNSEFYTDSADSDINACYIETSSDSSECISTSNKSNSNKSNSYILISNRSNVETEEESPNTDEDSSDDINGDNNELDMHENSLHAMDSILSSKTKQIDEESKQSDSSSKSSLSDSQSMEAESLSDICTTDSVLSSDTDDFQRKSNEADVAVQQSSQQDKTQFLIGKYNKNNPNTTIEFAMKNPMLLALKILMAWLNKNHDVLYDCCDRIPELTNKLMKLSDCLNLDLLSNRIYFEREFINIPNVREPLKELISLRFKIPLKEDIALKSLDVLYFQQKSINWNLSREKNLTKEEQCILRLTQIADFGFFICRNKKFGYHFCNTSRRFIRSVSCSNINKLHYSTNKLGNNSLPLGCETRVSIALNTGINRETLLVRKNQDLVRRSLAGEAAALEEKSLSTINVNITPFIVVDTTALIEFRSTIENLIGLQKSVVIVPKAVISDLNFLKKKNWSAVAARRWIDQQVNLNNQFLRIQKDNECLHIPTFNVPSKLRYESRTFVAMLNLCNYLLSARSDLQPQTSDQQLVTILCADSLTHKQSRIKEFSIVSIMELLSIRYEQVFDFFTRVQDSIK
ncbi:protein SMG5-like [Teleopsis dalmanni]|uniref:protein SMG5-like n=1 Tax=Teleopsis dalmanni TaxID=139649 RepID=UPI0018CCAB89|nr:protein SMG5-like [Teleopsis dalmanni]